MGIATHCVLLTVLLLVEAHAVFGAAPTTNPGRADERFVHDRSKISFPRSAGGFEGFRVERTPFDGLLVTYNARKLDANCAFSIEMRNGVSLEQGWEDFHEAVVLSGAYAKLSRVRTEKLKIGLGKNEFDAISGVYSYE